MPNVTLHLGDCLEYMRGMPDKSVDAVITDPPYGINGDYKSYDDTPEKLASLVPEFLHEAKRIAGVVAVFTGVKNMHLYQDSDWRLAWVCPAGTGVSSWGFTCWTPIAVYGKDPYSGKGSRPDVYVDYKPKREGWPHPYEKPLGVMLWSIERFCPFGKTVLDPFMGSGTTGVACVKLDKNFIGVELERDYYAIAERRIRDAQAQPSLFEAQP
mgnify:CR=1 FL=1